ncbi:AAA family ATPase [Egicoccus halophilus]|uniref:ATPase n=1 Tax=Egicoccus halophilus TaxID=1670830 RepID=A0A8J3A4U3_9ACTN|nr:MoxR family ATPase [Egicoccus halophilus]GGI02703.1 ATPase [Egicoccus halophilus]
MPTPMAPDRFARLTADVETQLRRVIVGQDDLVRDVLACLFAGGHVLLEGVPGLGKTMLLRTLAQTLSMDSTRLQCTPDLLPADVVGTTVLGGGDATGAGGWQASFEPGPVFTQLLLADELNRATPKTQSALLEAMAERRVTVAGVTRELPRPFFVMATQNPIEMEGTYPLPEAQLDRFLAKVLVPSPSADDLVEILVRTTGTSEPTVEAVASTEDLLAAIQLVRQVPMASHVLRHVAELVEATHAERASASEAVRRYVANGASPRGAQSLVLAAKVRALFDGRLQASVEDVREAALPCLRHRLVLGYEAQIAGVSPDDVVTSVLDAVPAPRVPA